MRDAANEGRQRLLETLADKDEAIMVAYISGEAVEASQIRAAWNDLPILLAIAMRLPGAQGIEPWTSRCEANAYPAELCALSR